MAERKKPEELRQFLQFQQQFCMVVLDECFYNNEPRPKNLKYELQHGIYAWITAMHYVYEVVVECIRNLYLGNEAKWFLLKLVAVGVVAKVDLCLKLNHQTKYNPRYLLYAVYLNLDDSKVITLKTKCKAANECKNSM